VASTTADFVAAQHRELLKRERVALREACAPGESLLVVAVANRRSRPGLLAVSERCVLFARLSSGRRKIRVVELPLAQVIAVERFRAWRQPCLVVETDRVRVTFRYLEGPGAADGLCAALVAGSGCVVRQRRLLWPIGVPRRMRKLFAAFR